MKNEKQLTTSLKKGDRKAFEQLYLQYSPKLYFFSLKYLKSPQEAEEVVQLTFLKIWENRTGIKPALSFNAYVIQIAKSVIWRLFKKQELATKYQTYHKSHVAAYSNSTEDYVVFSEMEQLTKQHIDAMPQKRKQVFMLSRYEGLSHAEIAEQLNISVGTVKQHMNQALKTLSENLRKNGLLALMLALDCFF